MTQSIIPSFEAYVEDRKYLRNVTPKTLYWFGNAWRAFGPALGGEVLKGGNTAITAALKTRITEFLGKGTKPVSVNSYLTCIRAYLNWLHSEGHLPDKPRVRLLKHEQKVIETFSPAQVQALITWKPRGVNETRSHLASCLMLDCGLRLAEVLSLQRGDVGLDNLLLTVMGKGRKQRRVPISVEMRAMLFRHLRRRPGASDAATPGLLFGTRNGTQVSERNFERDFKLLAQRVGIDGSGVRCSPHTLRHTCAVSYLRAGGNLFYLSRMLGHTSVTTTQRYLQSVGVEDLQAVHNGLSPLTRR